MTPQPNKKAVLRAKYPKVFQGLGKFKSFQLKLHTNPNVKPLAQQYAESHLVLGKN